MPICMLWRLESKKLKLFYIACFIQKNQLAPHQTAFS